MPEDREAGTSAGRQPARASQRIQAPPRARRFNPNASYADAQRRSGQLSAMTMRELARTVAQLEVQRYGGSVGDVMADLLSQRADTSLRDWRGALVSNALRLEGYPVRYVDSIWR